MAKIFGYGSQFIISTTTGDSVVGCVRSISGPSADGDDVDTTCLDSSTNFRTMVAGLLDPGEVNIELIYDPADTQHKKLASLYKARTVETFKVKHGSSTGDTDSFDGYVKSLTREIPLDDMITSEVTIKVSGDPGYTT